MWTRINVGDNERVLVSKNGQFQAILAPGVYRIFGFPWKIREEVYSLSDPEFVSEWAALLVKERAAVVRDNFVVVETGDAQVALVFADGKLYRAVAPGQRLLFWKTPREITVRVIDARQAPEAPRDVVGALARLGPASQAQFAAVEEGKVGLLFLDNKLVRALDPGIYAFWNAAGVTRVEVVDLRLQTLEIPGQEILTRDKVSIRVNVAADYRIVDAFASRKVVKDVTAYLYRALQLAVRRWLGTRTLEEILADKVEIEPAVASAVRAEMESAGVEVSAIALRDIVLPGEIRDILNQVVAAERQAQANLIRRREETAATRSLLNTAKLMEDNPILVRLKELETLEKLTEKVDRISVTGGFEGLLTQLLPESEAKK